MCWRRKLTRSELGRGRVTANDLTRREVLGVAGEKFLLVIRSSIFTSSMNVCLSSPCFSSLWSVLDEEVSISSTIFYYFNHIKKFMVYFPPHEAKVTLQAMDTLQGSALRTIQNLLSPLNCPIIVKKKKNYNERNENEKFSIFSQAFCDMCFKWV